MLNEKYGFTQTLKRLADKYNPYWRHQRFCVPDISTRVSLPYNLQESGCKIWTLHNIKSTCTGPQYMISLLMAWLWIEPSHQQTQYFHIIIQNFLSLYEWIQRVLFQNSNFFFTDLFHLTFNLQFFIHMSHWAVYKLVMVQIQSDAWVLLHLYVTCIYDNVKPLV